MKMLDMRNVLPAQAYAFSADGFADQDTPLVKNCWYVAARSEELGRSIVARRILGTEVAMYRSLSGQPVAVRNRCPHRSFPLAMGKLDGDTLVCGYHGMEFDLSGHCTKMPSMPITPSNANVRCFPMVETAPLVWIWMGDPELADESLIPDTSWLGSPEWKSVTGGFHMQCDYVSMHENLLDQTHFPFLHPGTVGTPAYARSTLEVWQEAQQVFLHRELLDSPPPGIYGVPTGLQEKNVNRYSDSKFASPAIHVAFAKIVDEQPEPGARSEYLFNITHLITPETPHSIHYWWFNSRNFKLKDEAADSFLADASTKAYVEDVDALEAILKVVTADSEPQFDLNFAPDKPGLLMRKILLQQAAQEAGVTLS